jgi:hypothetical protein
MGFPIRFVACVNPNDIVHQTFSVGSYRQVQFIFMKTVTFQFKMLLRVELCLSGIKIQWDRFMVSTFNASLQEETP